MFLLICFDIRYKAKLDLASPVAAKIDVIRDGRAFNFNFTIFYTIDIIFFNTKPGGNRIDKI